MQINGYQKFGLCFLFFISALSLLAFFEEDYETQQNGSRPSKKRKQKHLRSQTASKEINTVSPLTNTTSKIDSAQEKQKTRDEKRKDNLDFSFTAFNKADPLTREAMRAKTLVSVNNKSPTEPSEGIAQIFSQDDTKSIVQSPSLLLKGGGEVIYESDTDDDASSQGSTGKNTYNTRRDYTVPNYALEVGSPGELEERVRNLEEELEQQKMYTNKERMSRFQSEEKLRAESRLRSESEECLNMLKIENERQKKSLSEQLEKEKIRSSSLEEKIRVNDVQLLSYPNKLKKSNETNVERDGISPLLHRHTNSNNSNNAVMSSLTAAISV